MAGKHSKSFFDFRKNPLVVADDTPRKKISLPAAIIASVIAVALVVSAIWIGSYFIGANSHSRLLKNARRTFNSMPSDEAIETLAKKNDDIKGWIRISGTEIDCAVCHGDDNDFYKNHNQLGKKSRFGALYLSHDDKFDRGGDHNITIYGNNMNDGTMFGELNSYRELKFYKQHPFLNLYYSDKCETYAVYAVLLIPAEDDKKESYDVTADDFTDANSFNLWHEDTRARSIITTNVNVQYGDDILTLVTDVDDFDGARIAVMTKKVNEQEAALVNVNIAQVNAKPKFPMAWYDQRDMKYPY